MVRVWIQHASSHSTDMLIARYGNRQLVEKVIQGIESVLERWKKKELDTSEKLAEKGVVERGTVYAIIDYPGELLQQVEEVLNAHFPNNIDRRREVEHFCIFVKGVKTVAEARARLNKFVRGRGTRKTLFNMDATVITNQSYDAEANGVWIEGWTEDYDMCWAHDDDPPHFSRIGALTAAMVEGEDWLEVDELHSCAAIDDAEEDTP